MKINFKNVLKITKRELLSFLDNPAYYIVFIVFLLLWNFLVFRNVFIIGESSLSGWFGILPWLLLVFCSAVTMSTISKERDEGTLEFVLTHPVRELELVIGKYLASLVYTFTAVLFTILTAVLFNKYGSLDWGIYTGQLLASLFLLSSLSALGVFVSTLFSSQIAALLVTAGASFMFVMLGSDLVTISLPLALGTVFERISLLSHYDSVARGVLDLLDVLYFLLFTITFLLLANLQLLKFKFGRNKIKYTGFQTAVLILVGVVVAVSMLQNTGLFRYDLTQNNIYTLSASTKKVLGSLENPVTIKLYVSEQLPSQYAPILRELQYVLADYKTAGRDKIILETTDPSKDSAVEQEAITKGIQKVQFNVIGREELQLKTGYLGLLLSLGDKSEVIPFVQSTEDLEYELTSLIKKMSLIDKKNVAFLSGHGEKGILSEVTIVNQELSKVLNVISLTLTEENPKIPTDIDALVIAGSIQPLAEYEVTALKEYLSNGGNAIVLIDRYTINNSLGLTATTSNISAVLKELYGVSVENNLAYDLRQNETINLQEGITSFLVPYPLWLRSQVVEENVPFRTRLTNLGLPWASVISADGSLVFSRFNYKSILTTSNFGGRLDEPNNIDPRQEFPQQNLAPQVVGLVVEKAAGSNDEVTKLGRVAVIGDSEFLVDAYLQRSPENLAFGLDLISWAAGEDTLSDIQVKSNVFGRFNFQDENQAAGLKYTVYAASIIMPLLIGVVRYMRRRMLRFK